MPNQNSLIQKRVTNTILSQKKRITLGGRVYTVAPPSIGTLIMASEKISQLPDLSMPDKGIADAVLGTAKDGRPICEICALLILGAKKANSFWGNMRIRRIARRIELCASVKEVHLMLKSVLLDLELTDFFAISTFLTGINLTKPTKVETGVTASGQ